MANLLPDWNYRRIATTAVILLVVIGVGATIIQTTNAGQSLEGRQHFDEFCEDVYGDDASVHNAQVVGAHGGLHCSDGTRSFHYSQLPQDHYQSYLDGETSASAVQDNLQPLNDGVFGKLFGWVGLALIGVIILTIYGCMVIGPRPGP